MDGRLEDEHGPREGRLPGGVDPGQAPGSQQAGVQRGGRCQQHPGRLGRARLRYIQDSTRLLRNCYFYAR